MKSEINYKYPSVEDLRTRAKCKIPKFAFEYLDGGCNDDVNLKKNTDRIRDIELKPNYLVEYKKPNLKTTLFGHEYDAPFGISPVGLQGLMWPKSPQILAKAAFEHNIPFILSTVTTASIETIAEITEGRAWFQLYHPAEESVTKDILKRAETAGCPVLVILADVPSFGYRPRDIRNGLSMPPKMTMTNIVNTLKRPHWTLQTLLNGQPSFETLKPYMPKNLNLNQLAKFMDATFSGRLDEDKIKRIRDMWNGKLVLKGAESVHDVEKAYQLGLDGVIVSNHGGRQVDVGQATIDSLKTIAPLYKDKITIMMDSGIRGGADVARVMASGADFSFMGRTFMYGVSALGKHGGDHTILMLKKQLTQLMEQLSCGKIADFQDKLISNKTSKS
jgi:L-lactate dehydrogenase (cytochrome)